MSLLSVVIPVFNPGPYLEACLQSLPVTVGDCQIILVDDGSTDGSGIICDDYAARYPGTVSVIHQQNRGVASARNAGLAAATGEYIAWVDPDDLVDPEWYPAIAGIIREARPDVIVMDTLRFSESAEQPEVYGRPAGPVDRDLFVSDLYRDIRMLSGLPNKVFRAECLRGIRFDETLPILEDFAAMPAILRRVQTVSYIPRCLYRYRQHTGSLLHHVTAERAWLSFRIAVARADAAEPAFRSQARTAAALQAMAFCRNRHLHPDFHAAPEQIRACTHYLLRSLSTVCFDGEIPVKTRLKLALTAFGFSRPLKTPSRK